MSSSNKAIGGYFELELPQTKPFPYSEASFYQSARAAFLALLRVAQPSSVWIPRYICDSMLLPLKLEGVECKFYSIDDRYNIVSPPKLTDSEILLYVNYFGINKKGVDQLLATFDPQQIVLDYSQAFFSPPKDCLATLYSPRKFFGIPDGGVLVTAVRVEKPPTGDMDFVSRAEHLLTRLADSPQAGYAAYQRAESSLDRCEPRQMSPLTQRILQSVDLEYVKSRRNANFLFLHNQLAKINRLLIDPKAVDGPLCYPLWTTKGELRGKLDSEEIFVATYWLDVLNRVSLSSLEADFVNNVFPLPCDQRYGPEEMQKVANICRAHCASD